MIEAQTGAQGANPAAQTSANEKAARKRKSPRAQAYKTGRNTWSARVRRQGADIFLSGFSSHAAIEQEVTERVAALAQRGKPHGAGAERTSVAKALSDHALKHLPSLKGADQEARRINKYLREAHLPTLEVRRLKDGSDRQNIPQDAQMGAYCAVWLKPAAPTRKIPSGLRMHRKLLLTRTSGSDRIRSILANTMVADVTYELVQDLVRQLEAEGLARASVVQEVALLKRMFNHASRKWHWVKPAKNPACHLKFTGQLAQRERVMSAEEERRLDEAVETCMNSMVGPAIGFLTETAMRAEECLTAKWRDVDWDKRLLRLKESKIGARNVPLSPRAMEILQSLKPSMESNQRIFSLSYESLKAAWSRACERAGITDLHIHDLRHTAATRMALKSGNIFMVQMLTGHKTIEMVRRYVNVKAEDVVALMHAPQPAPEPTSGTQADAAATGALNAQALQAAMQMLQAAAAQLNPKPAPAAPRRRERAANDDDADSVAA